MQREPLPRSQNPPGAQAVRDGALPELRHYWLAFVLGFAGLIVSMVAGWQMNHWARDRDTERFVAECRLIAGMIQQKMERYESALARLRDVCAQHGGEVPTAVWNAWIGHILDTGINYPALRVAAVASKQTNTPAGPEQTNGTAAIRLPVSQVSSQDLHEAPPRGADLAQEGPTRPSFVPALDESFGWVSPRVWRVPRRGGAITDGIWFAIPLRADALSKFIAWQNRGETDEARVRRRRAARAEQATGVLVAFLSGDRFLAEYNSTNSPKPVQVRLFTSREPDSNQWLNPSQPPPSAPLFTYDEIMPWYGRRWLARFSSTPVFEAGSIRYRAWLVGCIGALLSLGTASAIAWQTRARWREVALASQLREALGRQERLSRDLHDGTLQSVYGVGLGLQRAQRLLAKRPDAAAGQLADTTLGLQRVVGELRNFIRETDPAAHEEVPLGEALQGVVSHFKSASEMELQLDVTPGADHELTAAQSLQLLNIAREALSNSVRHSQARYVRITLSQSSGSIRLEVADDGHGFDPEEAQRDGRGLSNLVARVSELGGVHRWETSAGQGSHLIVEVPK